MKVGMRGNTRLKGALSLRAAEQMATMPGAYGHVVALVTGRGAMARGLGAMLERAATTAVPRTFGGCAGNVYKKPTAAFCRERYGRRR